LDTRNFVLETVFEKKTDKGTVWLVKVKKNNILDKKVEKKT